MMLLALAALVASPVEVPSRHEVIRTQLDQQHERQRAAKQAKKPPAQPAPRAKDKKDCGPGTDCAQARQQEAAQQAQKQGALAPGAGKCTQTICASCDGICAPIKAGGPCVCQKRP